METVIEHAIEPEISGPPPRRAHLPLSTNLLLLAAALLFGLFIYGGSRALYESVKLAWLGVAGRTVTAHVLTVQTSPVSVPGETPRQIGLTYRYQFPFDPDGPPRTGTAHLEARPDVDPQRLQEPLPGGKARSATPLPAFHVGDILPLRCGLWLGRPLVYPWLAAPTGKIVFLMLCGVLVILISALLLRRIFLWRRHRLLLLRNGIATIGTVLHKHARAEDAPRYYVQYGYGAGTEPCEHEEQVSAEQWKRLDVGQPVTVLYDPDRVEDASLFQLLGK